MIEEQPPNWSVRLVHVPGGWVRATIASSMQIFDWTPAVALQVQRVTELEQAASLGGTRRPTSSC